jgi:TPR repeat protein
MARVGSPAATFNVLQYEARAGDTDAMNKLGVRLYHRGHLDEAVAMFRRAADAGDASGVSNLEQLGLTHARPPAPAQAIQLAAEGGDNASIVLLAELFESQGKTKAAQLWRDRAEASN